MLTSNETVLRESDLGYPSFLNSSEARSSTVKPVPSIPPGFEPYVETRLASLKQSLVGVCNRLQSDELIATMRRDPSSAQHVQARIEELLERALLHERENYIQHLVEELAGRDGQLAQSAQPSPAFDRLLDAINRIEQRVDGSLTKSSASDPNVISLLDQLKAMLSQLSEQDIPGFGVLLPPLSERLETLKQHLESRKWNAQSSLVCDDLAKKVSTVEQILRSNISISNEAQFRVQAKNHQMKLRQHLHMAIEDLSSANLALEEEHSRREQSHAILLRLGEHLSSARNEQKETKQTVLKLSSNMRNWCENQIKGLITRMENFTVREQNVNRHVTDDIQQERVQFQEQLRCAEMKYKRVEEERDQLNTAYQDAQNMLPEFQRLLASRDEELSRMKGLKGSLEQHLQEQKSSLAGIREEESGLAHELQIERSQRSTLEKTALEKQHLLDTTQAELKRVEERNAALVSDLNALQKRHNQLIRDADVLSKAGSERDRLEEMKSVLENRLEDAKQQHLREQLQQQKANQRETELLKENFNKELESREHQFKQEVQNLEIQWQRTKEKEIFEKVAAERSTIVKLQQQGSSLQEELEATSSQLEVLRKTHQDDSDAFARLQQQLREQQDNFLTRAKELERSRSEWTGLNKRLEDDRNTAVEQAQKLERENRQLAAQAVWRHNQVDKLLGAVHDVFPLSTALRSSFIDAGNIALGKDTLSASVLSGSSESLGGELAEAALQLQQHIRQGVTAQGLAAHGQLEEEANRLAAQLQKANERAHEHLQEISDLRMKVMQAESESQQKEAEYQHNFQHFQSRLEDSRTELEMVKQKRKDHIQRNQARDEALADKIGELEGKLGGFSSRKQAYLSKMEQKDREISELHKQLEQSCQQATVAGLMAASQQLHPTDSSHLDFNNWTEFPESSYEPRHRHRQHRSGSRNRN